MFSPLASILSGHIFKHSFIVFTVLYTASIATVHINDVTQDPPSIIDPINIKINIFEPYKKLVDKLHSVHLSLLLLLELPSAHLVLLQSS